MLKHYRNTLLDMSTIPGIYVTKITQNLKKTSFNFDYK